MKRVIASSLFLLLALTLTAVGQTREFRHSTAFQPGGELIFDTDKGSVKLTSWERNEVSVFARIEPGGDDLDADYARRSVEAAQVEITGDAHRLSIRSNFDAVPNKSLQPWNQSRTLPHIHYEIRAPRSLNLRLTADRSRVNVQGFDGRLQIQTDRTPVEARDLAGEVQIKVDRGEIRLDALRGSLNLNSDRTNSRIAAFAIKGDSRLNVSRGEVEVSVPDAQRLSVSARTGRRETFRTDFALSTNSFRNDQIEGTINGGGPRLSVEGDRSQVYLRRQ